MLVTNQQHDWFYGNDECCPSVSCDTIKAAVLHVFIVTAGNSSDVFVVNRSASHTYPDSGTFICVSLQEIRQPLIIKVING